jgi:large subunit ribosomal protein L31e
MAKKKEPKVKVERSYNIPLRKKTRETAKHKKTPRAIRIIREFLKKHMKVEEVKLGMHLNEFMWKHGIKNPPHHVKVHVIKEDDVVKAELEGFEYKELVKAETKKEPKTMKDKLEAKLGVKKPTAEEEKKEEKQKEEVKAEPRKEEAKEEKPAAEPKAEQPTEITPTAQELADAKKQ